MEATFGSSSRTATRTRTVSSGRFPCAPLPTSDLAGREGQCWWWASRDASKPRHGGRVSGGGRLRVVRRPPHPGPANLFIDVAVVRRRMAMSLRGLKCLRSSHPVSAHYSPRPACMSPIPKARMPPIPRPLGGDRHLRGAERGPGASSKKPVQLQEGTPGRRFEERSPTLQSLQGGPDYTGLRNQEGARQRCGR
jgi:hypothetical protein